MAYSLEKDTFELGGRIFKSRLLVGTGKYSTFPLMKEALEDTGLLAEMITQDLYHISQRILHPKFFWLKISYFSFFIGNLIALLLIGLKALS